MIARSGTRFKPGIAPLALLLACAAGLASAEVRVLDAQGLQQTLQAQTPCCIVDARSAAARSKAPIANALVYRADLHIEPSAAVLVLGDHAQGARKAALALEQRHPGKTLLAVGTTARVRELLQPAASGPGSYSFVIPHNTCETGDPLQVIPGKKP